ncbi:MAG TPA: hypothetical protein PL024_04755 [Thauera sp.]|nr:hypothetical protein [Thauera sp.]
MRLSQEPSRIIKTVIERELESGVRIWLFGSRIAKNEGVRL